MTIMIPVSAPSIGKEELENVIEAVKSGWISSKGRFIKEFEESFANYIGMKHGVAVSNGTVAIHLALKALNIGPGDEVIIPNLTFIAPASMTLLAGAKPVLVDVNKDYWCIDPDCVKSHISEKTKAIIIVHLYGNPADMDPLMEIAEKHGLYIIEDCAEAHGALYKGRKVGSMGHVSCFSFYGNKIITTGEGGMCLTNDEETAVKMRILRDHGMRPEKRYWHEVVGYNYRMTNLQAAIGVAQLRKIEEFIEKKRKIAKLYKESLENIDQIGLHPEMKWARNVYWLYSILLKDEHTRNKVIMHLERAGVETRRFFYPINLMPPYRKYAGKSSCPISLNLSKRGMNLPSWTELTEDQVLYIAEQVRQAVKNR